MLVKWLGLVLQLVGGAITIGGLWSSKNDLFPEHRRLRKAWRQSPVRRWYFAGLQRIRGRGSAESVVVGSAKITLGGIAVSAFAHQVPASEVAGGRLRGVRSRRGSAGTASGARAAGAQLRNDGALLGLIGSVVGGVVANALGTGDVLELNVVGSLVAIAASVVLVVVGERTGIIRRRLRR